MPSITSPGIGSGLDIDQLVSQLVLFEGQPAQNRLNSREATFQAELSGLGTFRSALDSFRTALEPLKELSGFGARTVSSSNEDIFTVSADSNVAPGSYDLEVVSLAQGQKLTSSAFADGETFVGSGTLTIAIDPGSEQGGTFSIDLSDSSETTLNGIRDAINSASDNPGVVASVVNASDGSHLVLSGSLTGTGRDITITASGGDGGLEALGYDPDNGINNLTEVQAAADAEIRIDSFTHFSKTNTVTEAIEGLTIDLLTAEAGTVETLSIGLDKDETRSLVDDFVAAYNGLVLTAQGLTDYNDETGATGALQGDSLVPMLMSRINNEFNTTLNVPAGDLSSLRELGMSVTLEGTLDVDEDVLDQVINENFSAIGRLFADESNGVAVRFDAVFEDYLKSDGILDTRNEGLQASIKTISDQRARLDERLISIETRLRKQFLALDTLVAELNSTSGFLGSQLANLPSPGALVKKQ
ncbi:MAG: flagellar filament capping protein FliD [Gammaproteobacteria bacterium]|nr:flagellar filament capping protein FliD [Gammaproteobacteria bacterium]